MKTAACIIIFTMMAFSLGAENSCSISGQVLIDDEGVLYIYLVDEQQFSVPFTGIDKVIVRIGRELKKIGLVPFEFENLMPGSYGVRVFLDTNGNEKLDRGLLGPSEPWGMSWQRKKPARIPKWKDIAFEVSRDIHGLVIDTR